jgi:hypothetical protein
MRNSVATMVIDGASLPRLPSNYREGSTPCVATFTSVDPIPYIQ